MSLVPRWFSRLPAYSEPATELERFFEHLNEQMRRIDASASHMSVSSDSKHIYVEVAVPGLTAKDLEVTLDHEGCLWVQGEKSEQKQDAARHFYQKAQRHFSYCIPLHGEIDPRVKPTTTCKDGVVKIVLARNPLTSENIGAKNASSARKKRKQSKKK